MSLLYLKKCYFSSEKNIIFVISSFYRQKIIYNKAMKNYLNFETDIKNLETELDKLKDPYNQDGISEVDTTKITDLQNEIDKKLNDVYSNLDAWQTTLVARHEDRPKSKFFIDNLID